MAPVVIPSSDIPSTDFTQYALIITTGGQSSTYYSNVSASVGQFEDYLAQGGVVQYQLATYGPDVAIVGGVNVLSGFGEEYNIILEPDHPLAAGLPTMLLGESANHNWLSNLPPDAIIITETQDSQVPTTAEYSYGAGLVIATGMTWEFLYTYEYEAALMMYNAVAYSLSAARNRWISADLTDGVIPAGGGIDITLTFNSTGLAWGSYEANLELTSNDPARPVELIPISLAVTPIGAPQISSITDQPGDEGGLLNLAFTASSHDIAGSSYPIEYYLVWQREPDQPLTIGGLGAAALGSPGLAQITGWNQLDSVVASMSASYPAQVATEIDSNHTGIHLVSLMVSAHTGMDTIPPALSMVERGYSVDNLPPATPLGIYATSLDTAISIGWVYDLAAVGDFLHFEVFRSNQQDFEPAPGDTALRITAETSIIDQQDLDNSLLYFYRVAAVDTNSNRSLSAVTDGVILEILASLGIPKEYALRQNYPNPFNPNTTLRFETPRQVRVELIVYDLRGREVVRLLDREMPPGYFDVIWNGKTATGAPIASGMYFARM
ncbi:MAG: hypothetical protein IIB42_09385, partial [Candidatus Marinimicrobia bacterium]|nr:hypothetical protein [Candidatus Neomarinimicrobiota bacterium]